MEFQNLIANPPPPHTHTPQTKNVNKNKHTNKQTTTKINKTNKLDTVSVLKKV